MVGSRQNFSNNNKKAVLSQGEPRDAAENFDSYRILQVVDNGTFMYTLNTAALSTRTHLAPKPVQNTLNHV